MKIIGIFIADTKANLLAAAEGEHEEWTELYKAFGDKAKEEGFDEIADVYYNIAEVEKAHEARYRKLLANIENGKVFKKDEVVKWKCGNCGYIHEDDTALDQCPACAHPQAYFEVFCETY